MFEAGTHTANRDRHLHLKHSWNMTWLVSLLIVCAGLVGWFVFTHHSAKAAPPCPCSVFTTSDPSPIPTLYNQSGGIQLGMKIVPTENGYISGIRFYKIAGMSGAHTAGLWDKWGNRIALANFTSESAAGWQEVDFSPVAVTANTLYTATVYMADGNYTATGNYFSSPITNTPLIAPQTGTPASMDGLGYSGQGVYGVSGPDTYPYDSFNATNYWIDAVYISSTSSLPPTVTSVTPAQNAKNALITDATTASFDKLLNASTISNSTVTMKDSRGAAVSGAVSYDSSTSTIKFIPDSFLDPSSTYTMTIKGGGGGVSDYEGHFLGADYVWSFTTSSATINCPCTLKGDQAPGITSASFRDDFPSGIELGLKVVPATQGYLTALRFYKPLISTQSTHVGHIWDGSNGTLLSTVTFSNESNYGWQEATLSTPLHVVKDHVYVISYGMSTAIYQGTTGGFTAPMSSMGFSAYPSGDSRNTASGSGTANSVYSSSNGTYPNQSGGNNYYWLDAVFSQQPTDAIPLHVVSVQPSDKSYGVLHSTTVSATFDQALTPSTVNASTVQVTNAGTPISGTVNYNSTDHQISFTPSSPFNYGATYTATLTTGITDVRGMSLGAPYTWTFTIGSQLKTDMHQGNGGPIVVFTNSTDPYGSYYAEILRTEGMPYFDVKDISTLSSATLSQYTTAVLSQTAVSDEQVATLTSWVNNGGILMAMRPDKKLAPLLGLSDAHASLTNAYLRTNTATAAGLGIVDTTIQYKGTADAYTLHGAIPTASLYADSSTSTLYPAATQQAVGKGAALSFSYDLARSVIALHQGNQAWAGQDRDGDSTIRSNDLYYGPAAGDNQPNWLDSTKMDIPQADEQQRLFANMITTAMQDHLPSPRFWYLPDNQKAALVLAGDDHGLLNVDGTESVLTGYLNDGATNCSVMDWQCVRASHYIYTDSELSDARALQFTQYGFEIADHPSDQGSCRNPTASELNTIYATEIANWRAKYVSEPAQQTSRFHCYLWTNWDMMPLADIANGVHYDLNTVAYPASWVGTHSPLVTGSGMNMRLTDASGALLDVRQGVTNFDNTSAGAANIAATLDNALGTNGFYGIFGSHYDMSGDKYQDTLLSVATSRNVPMISSLQALQWLNGRNSSNFSHLRITQSNETNVSFTIEAAEGAHGLQAMMPLQDTHGTITSITQANQSVPYQINIIKGIQYAQFAARPGDYVVSYSGDMSASPATQTSSSASTTPGLPATSSLQVSNPQTDATLNDSTTQIHATPSHENNSTTATTSPPTAKPQQWWQTPGAVIAAIGIIGASGAWGLIGLVRQKHKAN